MKIELLDWECNGYHDSDFFRLVADTESNSVYEEKYGTTRFPNALKKRYPNIKTVEPEVRDYAANLYREYLKSEIESNPSILVSDVVEIVAGRKYKKGNQYAVTGFSEFRDRYGRVQTQYVNFDDGRTSVNNVKLVSRDISNHFDSIENEIKFVTNVI